MELYNIKRKFIKYFHSNNRLLIIQDTIIISKLSETTFNNITMICKTFKKICNKKTISLKICGMDEIINFILKYIIIYF